VRRHARVLCAAGAVATSLLTYPTLAQGSTSTNGGLGPSLCSDVSAAAVSAIVGHRVEPAIFTGIATLSGFVQGPGTQMGCSYYPPGPNVVTTTGEVTFAYYLWEKPFSAAELKQISSSKGVSSCPGLGVAFCAVAVVRVPDESTGQSRLTAIQGRKELMVSAYKLPFPKIERLAKMAISHFF
jgi:hypothetical protein